MCLIRAAEERLEILHEQGRLHGSVYRSLGQEAGAVGVAAGLRRGARGDGDYLAPSIRAGGAVLVFGESLDDFFRQHLGRATGPSGGRQANVHRVDHARGIVGPVWPLGMMLEVVAGIALSFRLRGEDRVAAVFHGDGATSTGAWHEGLAFAAAQRCPLLLVVENNEWAFSTPLRGATRLESFTHKAVGYGIRADAVDGTDVVAVQDATQRAAQRARSGEGVQMLELRFFRRLGHAQHDAQDYVDPEVVAEWARRDPIDRSAHRLKALGVSTAEELDVIRDDAVARCAASADRVLAEPDPSGHEALEGVLTDGPMSAPWTRRSPVDPRVTAAEAR